MRLLYAVYFGPIIIIARGTVRTRPAGQRNITAAGSAIEYACTFCAHDDACMEMTMMERCSWDLEGGSSIGFLSRGCWVLCVCAARCLEKFKGRECVCVCVCTYSRGAVINFNK